MENLKELTSLPMDILLIAAHKRPDWRGSLRRLAFPPNGHIGQWSDNDNEMVMTMVVF
ncbi:hypothetical protein DPMN_004486 [Dreissena polymorpha]|uniref:Uncharacterized protein n=1 Tax=Dreissena polymorpha TaxID=45954 RepID=A0A9D4MRN4_DREPO|nr:hypothetical protein DPMN_004486 [Dreissena polymorpha]